MKKSVVDIYDLQEMAPFFKGRVGTWLGKLLIKCLRVDLVNKVHARNCHLRGAEFTSALLHDPIIDLSYEVHNKEILDHLPEGAFVTVSNHPIGSLDGIMLIDIFPNLIAEMIRFLCLSCADMILAITGFSFIGLGLGDNVVDWGSMILDARGALVLHPTMILYPIGAVILSTLCFNVIGRQLTTKEAE